MLVKCSVCGARVLNGRCEYCGFMEDSTPQAQPPSQSPAPNNQPPQPFAPSQPGGYPPQPYPQNPQPAIQPHVVIVNPEAPVMNAMPGVSRKNKHLLIPYKL